MGSSKDVPGTPSAGSAGASWPDGAVAIVGIGCRLPGGIGSPDELWTVLEQGRDLVGEVPEDRFPAAWMVSPGQRRPGKSYTAAGGFLEGDITAFDAEFFGISPKEASRLDPQQRLLLECAVEAFDDAGIDPARLAGGDTAVMMGVSTHDYADLLQRRVRASSPYVMTGVAACNTANRVSYVFDLRGPSAAVDTACSSTLLAVHQACEALRSGRSPLALAGGANVLLGPSGFIGFSQASMLSPTGRCRPFAAAADGFVRSEGAGVFVLKPCAAALADGDRIHAVILASGVNADGRTAGLALPSAASQEALLRRVHAAAGIGPDDVAYMEAHGTGTHVGDPIECQALGRAVGRRRESGPLPVGSVKSNLGHMEAAAGVPGLLKALLVLRERRIPATLHATPLSEVIDFAGLGLEPVTAMRPLDRAGRGVVGVNSFGFGGANAHLVLAPPPAAREHREEPGRGPVVEIRGPKGRRLPVLVSARTPQALTAVAGRWAEHLERCGPDGFYDVACTAWRRRARYEQRLVVLASDAREAAGALRTMARGEAHGATTPVATAPAVTVGRIAFVFNGNGSQWAGMGAELLADGAFRSEVRALDEELTPLLGWSVLDELAAPDDSRWARTEVAQPLLFAVQAGLVAALAARGIEPAAVTGHSVGEVAAAYCAGALGRVEACRVIAERGRAQAATAGAGRMAAVGMGAADAERLLERPAYAGRLVIAGINSDRDVTVAGDAEALAALEAELAGSGVFFRDLGLDYPFHSPAMDALDVPLKRALAGLEAGPGRIPVFSTVTGGALGSVVPDAAYWWRNVREPVRFADAVKALTGAGGCDVLVEIGPRPVLGSYLRRMVAGAGRPVAVVPTLSRSDHGPAALDTTLAHLLAAGARVDDSGFFPRPGRVVSLPAYPWQRERHWTGSTTWWREPAVEEVPADAEHPLLGARQSSAHPAWQQEIEPQVLTWLADHRAGSTVVLPGAAFVDMALSAGRQVFDGATEVTGLTILRALTLPLDDPAMDVRLHTSLSLDGAFTAAVRTGASGPWTEHARARVRRLLRERPGRLDLEEIRSRLTVAFTGDELYRICAEAGLHHGPSFRTATGLLSGPGEVLGSYAATLEPDERHVAHPTALDGAVLSFVALLSAAHDKPVPYLPAGVEVVRCWKPLPDRGLAHLRARTVTAHEAVWDMRITDTDGEVALELLGYRARRFDGVRPPGVVRLTEVLRAAPLPGTPTEASPLPSPGEVLAASAKELTALAARGHMRPYARLQPTLLDLAAHFTAAAVREFLPGRAEFTLDDLLGAGVAPRHRRLLHTLIDLAVRQGVLHAGAQDGRWRPAVEPAPGQRFAEAMRDFPAESVTLHTYGVCGRHLAAVLRGTSDPLELLFSDPDALTSRFYDNALPLRFHNQVARSLLRSIVAGWPDGRPLRVLEVGAGTGGTTAFLLPELPAERTHYTYTDLSPTLFPQARNRFADCEFVDYRILDLDADPAAQGFAPASFDLVIASNVLHATRDVTASVTRIADLLADDGHLLAVETHNRHLLAPIFGLLDSYWAATDTHLRPSGPLLTREAWPRLLEECGFSGCVQAGDTAEPARSDYSVILASREHRAAAPVPAAATAALAEGRAGDQRIRRWVVVGDQETGVGADAREAVAAALRTSQGPHAVTSAVDAASWPALFSGDQAPADIVLLVGDDSAPPAAATERAVRCLAVLRDLAAACADAPEGPEVTVWLVTLAGHGGGHCPPSASGAGAAAWGAARTLANEQPGLAVRRIALAAGEREPDTMGALAARLAAELSARPQDDEVLLTPGGRFVTRITPLPPDCRSSSDAATTPYTLAFDDPGRHYRLGWTATTVPTPGPGEVVVEVAAAGLNFRDITTVTGLVPAPALDRRPGVAALGLECAGTVVAVGPGVTHVTEGARVAGLVMGCFGSHALGNADGFLPIPDGMTFAEAATLPLAFLTVHHSLRHLARLAEGETLLIHGAAGGLGLAALQYAQRVGARVLATAGTPAKRDLLRLLGVEHVLDSRSLHFADQVLELTGDEGVDVVLNSLAGEAMARSLGLLKSQGRFLEVGKRDFLLDTPLPTAAFQRSVSFFGIDVSTLLTGTSALGHAHLDAMRAEVAAGRYRPLPHRVYPAARIHEAFALLQHSRHTGKIVVTFDEPVSVRQPAAPAPLDPDATYLITGGLGGFGAATARHLAAHGARHLTLVSRRGGDAPEAPALLTDLRSQGVQVAAHAADAADPDALRGVLADIDATGRRLAGVVHAAMVLDDAPLTELTDDRLRAVLAPKMTAGYLLDDLSRHRNLDFFVVHSSVAALGGNIRQAPYAAGNTALEAMVRERRRAGLPGLAVQWGAIADTGILQRSGLSAELAAMGLDGLRSTEALADLDRLRTRPDTAVAAVGRVDWRDLRRFLPALISPRAAALLPAPDEAEADDRLLTALVTATPEEALRLVEDTLVDLLAQVLQTTPDRLDRTRRLDQLGLDSLMGAELASLIGRRLGCEIPLIEMAGITTLPALTQRLLSRMGHKLAESPTGTGPGTASDEGAPQPVTSA